MRILHMSGGGSELHSSWTKGWSFGIKRCKKKINIVKTKVSSNQKLSFSRWAKYLSWFFCLFVLLSVFWQDAELQTLETDLAVHQQIYEAARKLSLEEHLSKPQKKSRLQQCKREEKKVKQLQEALFQHRNKSKCSSPCITISRSQISGERCCPLQANHCHVSLDWVRVERHQLIVSPLCADLSMSDDSSLSDVVALDDGEFNSFKSNFLFYMNWLLVTVLLIF